MTIIDWMFTFTAIILIAWIVVAARIVLEDRRERREWELADARAEWRAFVDAMRRLEAEDADRQGDA